MVTEGRPNEDRYLRTYVLTILMIVCICKYWYLTVLQVIMCGVCFAEEFWWAETKDICDEWYKMKCQEEQKIIVCVVLCTYFTSLTILANNPKVKNAISYSCRMNILCDLFTKLMLGRSGWIVFEYILSHWCCSLHSLLSQFTSLLHSSVARIMRKHIALSCYYSFFISLNFTWFRLVSSHRISPHLTLSYLTSHHFISHHLYILTLLHSPSHSYTLLQCCDCEAVYRSGYSNFNCAGLCSWCSHGPSTYAKQSQNVDRTI